MNELVVFCEDLESVVVLFHSFIALLVLCNILGKFKFCGRKVFTKEVLSLSRIREEGEDSDCSNNYDG